MKTTIMIVGAAVAAMNVFGKTSTPAGWTDDFDAALKQAAAEKKMVIADFSGSDWCCWCQRLDKEVFAQEEFAKVATNKYVCLMIDSPSDKKLLSEKAREQNPKIAKRYGVRGYPTVLVLDEKGEVLFKTGYRKGGPAKYLEHLEKEVKDAPMVNKHIKPIEEKLEKAEKAIEEAIGAKEKELRKDGASKKSKEFRDQMMKVICTEILPQRMPDFRKAIDEAKAAKVPAEMEEKKADLIRSYEGMYKGMSGAMKDFGKDKEKPAKK